MAKLRSDRVKEVFLTTGTGTVALIGSGSGFLPFSAVCVDGSQFDYAITNPGTTEWETGVGYYVASTNSVVRLKVVASSNNNQLTNFGAGNKQIFITINSESLIEYDRGATNATALAIALGG